MLAPRYRTPVGLGLILVAGTVLRLIVSGGFHAPAGDGIGFHRLSHELRAHHRLAFDPPPAPLAWTREPAWPVVLAAVDPGTGNDIETVLVWGTRLNALLDLVTALFVFLALREAGLGGAAWVGAVLVMLCPLFILNSCYILRETISTTVGAAILWTATVAWRRAPDRGAGWLLATSALVGLAALVRIDLLVLAVACLPGWWALSGARRKIAVAAGGAALCLLVFSPWPARNYVAFGDPHPLPPTWQDVRGNPMPTGFRAFLRTWVDDLHESWMTFRLSTHGPMSARDLHPRSYRTEEERRELLAIFDRYNKEGMSPAVDGELRALAWRRIRERPFYTLAYLPLRRATLWWWHFSPPEEQPLKSRILGQPDGRFVFEWLSHAFMLLGIAGAIGLALRRSSRGLFVLVAASMVVRSLVLSFAAPDGGYQRYLSPVYPMLLVCVAALPFLIRDRLSRRARDEAPPAPAEPQPAPPPADAVAPT